MLSLSVHLKLLVDFLTEYLGVALVLLELSRLITRLHLRSWLIGAPAILSSSHFYILRGLLWQESERHFWAPNLIALIVDQHVEELTFFLLVIGI